MPSAIGGRVEPGHRQAGPSVRRRRYKELQGPARDRQLRWDRAAAAAYRGPACSPWRSVHHSIVTLDRVRDGVGVKNTRVLFRDGRPARCLNEAQSQSKETFVSASRNGDERGLQEDRALREQVDADGTSKYPGANSGEFPRVQSHRCRKCRIHGESWLSADSCEILRRSS